MLKNDLWINQKASEGMIKPFQSNLVRHLEPDNKQKPVLSYGCSSYGYDLRLSSKECDDLTQVKLPHSLTA